MSKLPTAEEVEESLEVNIGRLRRHSDEIHKILFVETEATVDMQASETVKLTRLRCAASNLGRIVGAVAPCSPGCDHCCKMAVSLPMGEAILIGERIGVKPVMPKVVNSDRNDLVKRFMGVPCVFLQNGQCSIYEDRPLACRTHFNVSAYPELCNIIDHPAQDTPAFDFSPMWMAAMQIAVEANDMVFADLRQYFPNGLG